MSARLMSKAEVAALVRRHRKLAASGQVSTRVARKIAWAGKMALARRLWEQATARKRDYHF